MRNAVGVTGAGARNACPGPSGHEPITTDRVTVWGERT